MTPMALMGRVSITILAALRPLASVNCTNASNTNWPCMYGLADSSIGLVDRTGNQYLGIIDSPGLTQTVGLNSWNFLRNWANATYSQWFQVFGNLSNYGPATPITGINVTASAPTPHFARATGNLPQNLTVAAINYCTNAFPARRPASSRLAISRRGRRSSSWLKSPSPFRARCGSGNTLTVISQSGPLILFYWPARAERPLRF
jgi:hypothetical protein